MTQTASTSSKSHQRKTRQSKTQVRVPIPGVGGVIPARPKQTKPSVPVQTPTVGPAPVLPPGQSLPGFGQTSPFVPAIVVSRLIYGVGIDRSTPLTAALSSKLKALGATNLRIELSWADIEKTRGVYDWTAADRLVRYAAALKIAPVCTVAGITEWAKQNKVADPRPYIGRFALALGKRYKGQITHWEYDPEPDAGPKAAANAKAYLGWLREFATNIRKADSSAQVAVGGLTVRTTEFLEALYAGGGRPYFDAVCLRATSGMEQPAFDWVERCHDVMVRHGDSSKNIWLTDWGWSTGPGREPAVTAMQQARLLRETILGIRSRPFITVACYRLLADSADSRAGLCNSALQARPAFSAFKELARGELLGPARAYKLASLRGIVAAPGERVPVGPSVNVTVDAGKTAGPIPALWEGFVHDSDQGGSAELAAVAQKMRTIGANLVRFDPFPNPESVRQEGVIVESSDGRDKRDGGDGSRRQFTIDWTYADGVIDSISRMGATPWIDFGTMPTSLSSPGPNSRMPRDSGAWTDFIKLVVHRYNVEQKRGIRYWELSDEPDKGQYSQSEWLGLYGAFAAAVKEADPSAKVGGPSLSRFDAGWLKALTDRCAEQKLPLDFVSWHASDLSPRDLARQVSAAHALIAAHPALKRTEVVISRLVMHGYESPDNDGMPAAMYAAAITENLLPGPPVRALYATVRERADYRDPAVRFSGRSGLFTQDDRPKAVYNAMRLLSSLTGDSVRAESDDSDLHVLASRDKYRVSALLWLDSLADVPEGGARDSVVHLRVNGMPWTGGSKGSLRLLDDYHGNLKADFRQADLPPAIGFDVPAGESEIPLVMASGSMMLVELTPAQATPLSMSLESSSYVAFGGTILRLSARLTNPGTAPVTTAISLGCTDSKLTNGLRSKDLTLKPGESTLYEFAIPIPLGHAEVREYFDARAGSAAAGAVARITPPVYVRFDPPWVDLQEPNGAPDSLRSMGQTTAVVENRSDRPLKVAVGAARTPQTAIVPARSEASIDVNVPSPSTKPGNYEAAVRIEVEGMPAGVRKLQVRVPAMCPYTPRRPHIDGYLTEWNTSFPILLDSPAQLRGKPWNGPADISAQVYAMWDELNLYIAATVEDDVLDPALDPQDMADGDCLIFALTGLLNRERDGYGPGDYEIGISLGEDKPAVYRFAGGIGPGLVRGSQAMVRQDGGRTIYEAAIPWAELGPLHPGANQRLGFSVVLHDSDGPNAPKGYMEWAGGIVGTKRPGKYISLRLTR